MKDSKGLVPVTQADKAATQSLADRIGHTNGITADRIAETYARHRADALTEALQVVREAHYALLSARAFILEKHGTKNPQREEAIEALTAFIAQHEGEA